MSNVPVPLGAVAPSTALAGEPGPLALAESFDLIERWAASKLTARCSASFVAASTAAMRRLARRLGDRPLIEASPDDVEAWLATVKFKTRRDYTSAVRSFSAWAAEEGLMGDHLLPPIEVRAQPPSAAGRAVTKYLAEKEASGVISRQTSGQRRNVLYDFLEHCPEDPSRIDRRHVLAYLGAGRHLSAATRRFHHVIATGFTGWLQRRRILRYDPFADIPAPKVPQPAHRALDATQVTALVAACQTRREHVLVLVALHTGLRRAELAALEIGDVSLSARTVMVRKGKGGHYRLLPLSDEVVGVVVGYLASEGLAAGPLFRNELHPERGISSQTVWRTFSAVAVRAGVKVRPGDGVSTHAARHTFATDAHRASGDVLVVQALLGHAALSTTQRYVATIDVERLRAAVAGRTYLAQPAGEGGGSR